LSEDEQTTYYPWDETRPLLDWYAGVYDRCFVALHPFVRVRGLDPAACFHGTAIHDGHAAAGNLLAVIDERERAEAASPLLGRAEVETLIREQGEPVSWAEVCAGAGFAGLAALNHALLTSIRALKTAYEDADGAARLGSYCRREWLFMPTEGGVQPLMLPGLRQLFVGSGCAEVVQADDVGSGRDVVPIEDFLAGPAPGLHPLRRLFASDRRLLATVHWDSFFTLICGDSRLDRAHVEGLFEGFWCTSRTMHSWWRPTAI
jgi:hypothetical protein